MLELGNVQNTAYGRYATNQIYKRTPNPIRTKASIKIADDDTAAAVIRTPLDAETKNVQQDSSNPDAILSLSRPLSESTEPQPKDNTQTSENSRHIVYTEAGEQLVKLKKEIEAIKSFDGFLLSVREKIEKYTKHVEFGLGQVQDVEQHISKLRSRLELDKFSLSRIREDALKELRCQGNLEPKRVLHLLKD